MSEELHGSSYERELGQMHTEIKILQKDVSEIKNTQTELRDVLVGTKGAWRVLVVAATLITSALSVFVYKLSAKFFG